ncbi:hypothetical protein BpHYR1_038173 [Brachionus plicatilis]|uniref:Uncharacterized protein n=1 Tax=Brachionus plicatilis TaxID=10195 RepID=A0A3M7PZA7_BRAPC|nr:hypothetical protein BpHYR1_038173 [Brachionus plicatilis]
MLGQPCSFIRLIKDEIDNFEDGLFQRYLMSAPNPLLNSLKDIRKSSPTETSMTAILYMVHKLNEKYLVISFDKEAEVSYDSNYDNFRKSVVQAYNFDSFLR